MSWTMRTKAIFQGNIHTKCDIKKCRGMVTLVPIHQGLCIIKTFFFFYSHVLIFKRLAGSFKRSLQVSKFNKKCIIHEIKVTRCINLDKLRKPQLIKTFLNKKTL